MFGWRRRSEGFEWQEYVRTTVLVRRADRQRKIDDARLAALAKVQNVRDRGIDVGKAKLNAATDTAATAATGFAHHVWTHLVSAAKLSWRIISIAAVTLWGAIKRNIEALSARISWPDLGRYLPTQHAKRWQLWVSAGVRDKGRSILGLTAKAAAVLAVILIGGQALQGETTTLSVAALVPDSLSSTPEQTISGRAIALSGDRLRLDGRTVQLASIAAPDVAQPCTRANGRTWRCGRSATLALARLVKSKTTECVISGQSDDGAFIGSCKVGDFDVAAELVRDGHVFADGGILSAFGAEEAVARDKTRGVWDGETLHPAEWRDKAWADAKQDAPNGCPIVAYQTSREKLYVMPWSKDYARRTRKASRDDQGAWFCSEQEAEAAGYTPSGRS